MVVWARLGTAMPRIAGLQCKCAAGSNSALAALPQPSYLVLTDDCLFFVLPVLSYMQIVDKSS